MQIAITQRVIENETYAERRDALSHDWSNYLCKVFPGCAVLPVPNTPSNVSGWFDSLEIDAVLLSNGNDWLDAPDRDQTEKVILEQALEMKIPVLGVCRGLQVLNVLFGGDLENALPDVTDLNHVARNHQVRLLDSVFIDLAKAEQVSVNSYHNQGVVNKGLAPDLKAFAMAEDDVVEGIYHPQQAVMAIQWHPERNGSSAQFDALIMKKFFTEGAFWR
jgi:putative glutamine amidotransferase